MVGVLRETLASTLQIDQPMIVGAGRTDSGVHAFGQVVHVDLPLTLFSKERDPDPERLMRSLNQQLRGRIKVLAARPVGQDFHARFSATWREYRCLVLETSPPALGLTDSDCTIFVPSVVARPTLTRTSRSCAASRTRGGNASPTNGLSRRTSRPH